MSKRPRPSVLDGLRLSNGRNFLDAMRESGLSEATVRGRLKKGDTPDEALRPVFKPERVWDSEKYPQPYQPELRPRFRALLPELGPIVDRLVLARADAIEAIQVEDALRASLLESQAEIEAQRDTLQAGVLDRAQRLSVLDAIRAQERDLARLRSRLDEAQRVRRSASERRDRLECEAEPLGRQVLELGPFNARPALAEYLASLQRRINAASDRQSAPPSA